MSRAAILERVRAALRPAPSDTSDEPPAVKLRVPDVSIDDRVANFMVALQALAGKVCLARDTTEARDYVTATIAGRDAIASNAQFLRDTGIVDLPGVARGLNDREQVRSACASAAVGITSADYALADTGSLVMFSSHGEARLISLLPPVHVAVIPRQRILSGLDELLTVVPKPADRSSSMVFITGPSRTADIEQILVRGVHGPGEIHVVII